MSLDSQLHLVEIVAAMKEITARISSAATVAGALDDVLDVTGNLLPDRVRCAVALVSQGEPATFAANGLAPEIVDEIRYADGDGPCMQAIRTREYVLSQDLAVEPRWPAWSAAALRLGVRGVLCYPFDVDMLTLGALTVYAEPPDALDSEVSMFAMLVADHASLLLRIRLRQLLGEQVPSTVEELAGQASAEQTVQRAVGIVMAQRGCRPEQALSHLMAAADHLGVRVDRVAQRLVERVAERAGAAAG